MGHEFDDLAKAASGAVSRREAFWRLGGGLALALLASLGLTGAGENCGLLCAQCCSNLNFPPRSPEHGRCVRLCMQGEGPCGPIVCPPPPPQ